MDDLEQEVSQRKERVARLSGLVEKMTPFYKIKKKKSAPKKKKKVTGKD